MPPPGSVLSVPITVLKERSTGCTQMAISSAASLGLGTGSVSAVAATRGGSSCDATGEEAPRTQDTAAISIASDCRALLSIPIKTGLPDKVAMFHSHHCTIEL